jgi:hypothetical protein
MIAPAHLVISIGPMMRMLHALLSDAMSRYGMN